MLTLTIIIGPVLLFTWTLWLTGQATTLIAAGKLSQTTPVDAPHIALKIVSKPGTPRNAWPHTDKIPGPLPFYLTWAGITAAHLTGGILAARPAVARLTKKKRTGFATQDHIQQNLTAQAVLARAPILRPARANTTNPHTIARKIGHTPQHKTDIYIPYEYSELIDAAARQGKTARAVIGRVLDADGAVISTSTRLDVAAPTFDIRAQQGPAYIFEPQGILKNVPRLRWSPIHGCQDRLTAILRGRAFAAGSGVGGNNVENGEYFENEAAAIIRALLHAAALDDATIRDVAGWATDRHNNRPERILRAHHIDDWASELANWRRSESRTADNVASVVRRAFDSFADPRVLQACSPPPTHAFDATTWLKENGTLYIVGTRDAQASVTPLLTALIEDIVAQAKNNAMLQPGGRSEPPLHLILDEAYNIAPLPSLPSLMSEGGGSGISTTVVAQTIQQIRARWGREGGAAIIAAANTRITLGGSTDVDALKELQALAGHIEHTTSTASWSQGRTNISENTRRDDVLDLAAIRGLAAGHALVFTGNLPPVEIYMPGWWERDDSPQLKEAHKAFHQRIGTQP